MKDLLAQAVVHKGPLKTHLNPFIKNPGYRIQDTAL